LDHGRHLAENARRDRAPGRHQGQNEAIRRPAWAWSVISSCQPSPQSFIRTGSESADFDADFRMARRPEAKPHGAIGPQLGAERHRVGAGLRIAFGDQSKDAAQDLDPIGPVRRVL
jgi:hypothetical protein